MKRTTIAEELKSGNTVTYFTVGVSMRPLLAERETHVMIAPLEAAKNGDILLYIRANGQYVLHRLIKQDARFYYMRGDNTYGLERIEKAQATGAVTHIYRKGKCFSVDNKKYKMYVCVWNIIYPLRWCFWKLKALMKKILK